MITSGSWIDLILLNSKVGIHQLLFEFEYAKLKKCFPCYWLNKLYVLKKVQLSSKQNDSYVIEVATGDFVDISSFKTKHFYLSLLKQKLQKPNVTRCWEYYLNFPISFNWQKAFNFNFQQIGNNMIKHVNFKILHNIFPSKHNLCIWRIMENDQCDICKKQKLLMSC